MQQFLLHSLSQPFAYGQRDCCLWVADAVEAMTGTDIAAPFRGRYHSRAEAVALCFEYTGQRSLRRFLSEALLAQGLTRIPVGLAQRGDLVLVRRGKDHSLGVINLSGRDIMAAAEEGYLRLPLDLATCAWRV